MMSPPDYDANLVPAPSLTREFEAIPGYHEPQVRAAFKLSPISRCSRKMTRANYALLSILLFTRELDTFS